MDSARTLAELANGLHDAAEEEDATFGEGSEDAEDMRAHAKMIADAAARIASLEAALRVAREGLDQCGELIEAERLIFREVVE